MELPRAKVKALRNDPRLLTIFGQSKVGKTTKLSELDNCLIIDTEEGTDMVDALKTTVSGLKEFVDVVKELQRLHKEEGFQYDYVAVDTIDNLVIWIEKSVCKANGVTQLIDIAYGAGYNEVRTKTMDWIKRLKRFAKKGVIVVGHRKKTLLGEEGGDAVATSSLELSGKLKNLVMADSDAIGFVYRRPILDKEEKPTGKSEIVISFKADDETEAGARAKHLRGQILPFEWDKIFIDKTE